VEHQLLPVSSLEAHKRNYRAHPPEQIKHLVASLQRFSQVKDIVVKKNTHNGRYTVLAGHGVVEAARECYMPELQCVIVPASWSEQECEAYLVADNHISNGAVDDEQLLARILQEQMDAGFDLASLGSDEESLRQMLQGLGDEVLEDEGGEEEIPGINAPDLPYKNQFAVAVMCGSEEEQKNVFDALVAQGYTCKVLVV